MGVLIKPNIKIDSIDIEMDKQLSETMSDRFIFEIGRNIPIIKINNTILGLGDLLSFSLQVRPNLLPSFRMVIDDQQYIIREALKQEIDKCVIFLGFKDFYLKFNAIIKNSFSQSGDINITLIGDLYNEKLFQGQQFSFKDKTVQDILKNICEQTSMGLFTVDNTDLSKQIDYALMTGTRYLDYFQFIIENYTTNLWSVDPNYFFHVVDIDTLKSQPLDQYSIAWNTGKPMDKPVDMIFKSVISTDRLNESEDKESTKIPINFFTINTNFSEIFKNTYSEYSLGINGNEIKENLIASNKKVGIGSNKTNTFSEFLNHKNPFYSDRINKKLGGNNIRLFTENITFELSPFSVINTELYLPFRSGEIAKLDTEHSGKKIVLGYTIDYEKSLIPKTNKDQKDLNKLTQTIDVI